MSMSEKVFTEVINELALKGTDGTDGAPNETCYLVP